MNEVELTDDDIKEKINHISSLAFFSGTQEEAEVIIKKLNLMGFEEFQEFKGYAKIEASRSIRFLEKKIKDKSESMDHFENLLSESERAGESIKKRQMERKKIVNNFVQADNEKSESDAYFSEMNHDSTVSDKVKMEICIKRGVGNIIKSLYEFDNIKSKDISQNIIVKLSFFGKEILQEINNQFGVDSDGE